MTDAERRQYDLDVRRGVVAYLGPRPTHADIEADREAHQRLLARVLVGQEGRGR